ncbi:hypothetical protein P280DRAFT_400013 [Massarina eburnea CBS 473.64]|uniref:Uncharacterized protein n=1 Tax=Massarina eburnea CBS 473.64 TaxID=1395130 RepID=A0A6A6S076_9PLEO|nr:hypothetical protein P280DRAFT_400013 [Massarina eburnea CBS 473.64]
MPSPAPRASNLTALLQSAPTAGNARLARCSSETSYRLRHLNPAEVITLFTPFVPHPPGTALAKNMDPFEPLGRAFRRQVRHVPYRLDHGMTETHGDFLEASGAIVIVICSAENVVAHNAKAFEQQLSFARAAVAKTTENKSLAGVPVVLLLITNGAAKTGHESSVQDFPTLITLDEYSPAALSNAVQVMFGK